MKALVIGGNRFVGRHLVDRLLKEGYEVSVLNRGRHGHPWGETVEHIVCDRTDAKALKTATLKRSWDVIFDQVCFEASDARAACEVLAGSTRRYVFTSTISVYSPAANIDERVFTPRNYQFSVDADSSVKYGEAKRQCESVFFQKGLFSTLAVRFPIICGPNDYTGRLQFHILAAKTGERIYIPNPEAKISFIEEVDAADALYFLSQTDYVGSVNASAPDAVPVADVLKWVEIGVGKKVKTTNIEITGEPSPYGIKSDYYCNTELAKSLGFSARPLREWMPDLIKALSQSP